MSNPHRENRRGSPESRKSIQAIHLQIEQQNRLDRIGKIKFANKITADSIVDAFKKSGINTKGVNGVYDPIQNKILDANNPVDKMRIQELFKSGTSSIGFNSVTDTRAGPNTDIELIRKQLRDIEAKGGIPSLGFDEGSLEANNTIVGDTDTIMSKLLDNQRSTGIVSPDRELEIRDNPRFTGNIQNKLAKLKQKLAAIPLQKILDVKYSRPNVDDAYGRTIQMSPSKFLQVSSGTGGNKIQRDLSDAHSNPKHSGHIFTTTQKDYSAPYIEGKDTPLIDQMKTDNNVNVRGDELGGVEMYKRKLRRGDAIETPDFSISSNKKIISGHEGRHRARAFKEEGIKKIPVNLVAYSGARADELGIGLKNRTRTKLQGIKPQENSGSGEKDTRAPIFGRKAQLQKLAVDVHASASPESWEKFWNKSKQFQVSEEDVKSESSIPSVEMQREDEKFSVGPHSKIEKGLTLANKDVEVNRNLHRIRKNIFNERYGTSPDNPPIGTPPKIRPPKPVQLDRIRGLQAKLNKQKLAVRFQSSFGPDLDAIDAFKKGVDYQGFTGKGKAKRLKFEVTDGGNTLKLLGHTIASRTNKGITVSNAGFDTGLTYASLKELGINAKRLPNGQVTLHNKTINATSGQKVTVPHNEVSDKPIRAEKPQKQNRNPNRTITEQSTFRQRVQGNTPEGQLPLSTSSVQPKDQRQINKITGVKSPVGKPIRATEAHHIFGVDEQPKLRNNINNGLMVTRKEHREVTDLNKGLLRKSQMLKTKLARLKVLLQ